MSKIEVAVHYQKPYLYIITPQVKIAHPIPGDWYLLRVSLCGLLLADWLN